MSRFQLPPKRSLTQIDVLVLIIVVEEEEEEEEEEGIVTSSEEIQTFGIATSLLFR